MAVPGPLKGSTLKSPWCLSDPGSVDPLDKRLIIAPSGLQGEKHYDSLNLMPAAVRFLRRGLCFMREAFLSIADPYNLIQNTSLLILSFFLFCSPHKKQGKPQTPGKISIIMMLTIFYEISGF